MITIDKNCDEDIVRESQIKPLQLMLMFMLVMVFLTLTGCSGKAKHPPRKGEYGQTKFVSEFVSSSKIDLLNSDALPEPFFSQSHEDMVSVNFEVDSPNNPYRFVMVVRGRTQHAGEVDLQFLGGVIASDGALSPSVIREEDSHSYKANEPVMLILPSDPFSINVNSFDNYFAFQAGMTEQNNIVIEDIELQVWSGKGSKYPMMTYLSFFSIIAIVLLVVYRFVSGLQPR